MQMTNVEELPSSLNLPFIEALYTQFMNDPQSVSAEWRDFFSNGRFRKSSKPPRHGQTLFDPDRGQAQTATAANMANLQDRVDQLVRAYRVRGHLVAQVDPLGFQRAEQPELDPQHYGLTEKMMDLTFSSRTIAGTDALTLRDIIQRLKNTYCRSIGIQFMHIDDLNVRHWLQDRTEGTENRIKLSRRQQFRILTRLIDAVVFEEFIQKKYVGAKSFSLEGCESLLPLLDMAIERANKHGVDHIVIGMAHRGRLNVLTNVMGKRPQEIFSEFEDAAPQRRLGSGDVKYHLGYSQDYETAAGQRVHLSLCFNPSHVEFINPVALGRMRAKQDRAGDTGREHGLTLLIHGDAAFAGEGIVQETLNLSELDGYTVGGTVHVIVNNQIGFTTSPSDGRSNIYASAIGKMLQIPIFHVNGENPEAVAQVIHLAIDFRQRFKRDVIIDMYGYRRHGHNESDEPSFTQPVLYRAIENRKSVYEGYLDHLLELGGISREQANSVASQSKRQLEKGLAIAKAGDSIDSPPPFRGIWTGYRGGSDSSIADVDTTVDGSRLQSLLRIQAKLPEHFCPHPKMQRLRKARLEMADGKRPLDWSAAESLAFASLATEGLHVRLSGQDSQRGTFSHRHAVLHDYETGEQYVPLQNLAPDQAPVEIYNSPLSELGVLGFEYGYSLDCPDGLVAWEAQFGDFVNAAQVIVDQFIVSAADKWNRYSGIVLLLPHGFEGQGPEHSSARLERFLLLAAESNIQVVYPSTPAQLFHCLRRQVLRPWRVPLIVMTPKSLLRHPQVTSSLEELSGGGFRRVIPDVTIDAAETRRILLCSGKIYYELLAEREDLEREDVAIVRLEQLYPLRDDRLQRALLPYADSTPVYWVQEEPENMGAWRFLDRRLGRTMFDRFPFEGIFRAPSSSPATGSKNKHRHEQQQIIRAAFGDGGSQTT